MHVWPVQSLGLMLLCHHLETEQFLNKEPCIFTGSTNCGRCVPLPAPGATFLPSGGVKRQCSFITPLPVQVAQCPKAGAAT